MYTYKIILEYDKTEIDKSKGKKEKKIVCITHEECYLSESFDLAYKEAAKMCAVYDAEIIAVFRRDPVIKTLKEEKEECECAG
jgi:hypothetical protein